MKFFFLNISFKWKYLQEIWIFSIFSLKKIPKCGKKMHARSSLRSCNQQLTLKFWTIFWILELKNCLKSKGAYVRRFVLEQWHYRPRLCGDFWPYLSVQLTLKFAEKWGIKCDWQFGDPKDAGSSNRPKSKTSVHNGLHQSLCKIQWPSRHPLIPNSLMIYWK